MYLLKHEFYDVASRVSLWLGTLVFFAFILNAVGHLGIEEDEVTVAIYQRPADTAEMIKTFGRAQSLMREMAEVRILEPRIAVDDVAAQMLRDNADIAISRTIDGWRFTLKSRSSFEHKRLVRVAQVLGASLSQERPWALVAYDELRKQRTPENQTEGWPTNIQISGVTADPGRHARIFVPKTIALLAYFAAFAFACRSMIRDTANNTLPTLLVSARVSWFRVITAKTSISVVIGVITLWWLLLFAATYQDFQIKDGLIISTFIQVIGLIISALLGVAFSLMARTESRIYFIASGYLVLLILLSGLIAKIDPKETILSWISSIFPLGYAMDVLSDWMFFGVVPSVSSDPIQMMFAILILSGVIVFGSTQYYKRTI